MLGPSSLPCPGAPVGLMGQQTGCYRTILRSVSLCAVARSVPDCSWIITAPTGTSPSAKASQAADIAIRMYALSFSPSPVPLLHAADDERTRAACSRVLIRIRILQSNCFRREQLDAEEDALIATVIMMTLPCPLHSPPSARASSATCVYVR